MVDFHAHLLSSDLEFHRVYDKVALKLFGKRFGIDTELAKRSPYEAYKKALVRNIKNSKKLNKSVIFGVDGKYDQNGNFIERDQTVCASNEAVWKLYRENQDIFIPFFSINPLRKDALDEVQKYHTLGFKGAKFLQNYWQVDTNDPRLIPYYELLKALNLPLIIHVGSESSVSSNKRFESLDMIKLALEVGVTVVVAHMALDYERVKFLNAFSRDPSKFNKDYYRLLEWLKTIPHLYADLSAILTPVRAKVLPHLSKEKDIHPKLLFATDFPVPYSILFNSYDLPITKRIEFSKIVNHYDRYIAILEYYFGKESDIFTNYQKLLAF